MQFCVFSLFPIYEDWKFEVLLLYYCLSIVGAKSLETGGSSVSVNKKKIVVFTDISIILPNKEIYVKNQIKLYLFCLENV